jgi:hypothetical protein
MTDLILLCSGITKGMKSYGPKATIPIGKKKIPLIVDQILKIKQNKNRYDIHIVVGFEHKKILSIIEDYKIKNIDLVYDSEYEHHNSSGALLSVIDKVQDKFIVFEDGVISSEIPNTNTTYLPTLDKNSTEFNIGTTSNNSKIEYLFYDLPNLWAEFFSVSSNNTKEIKELLTHNRSKVKKMFLFEMINFLIDNDIVFVDCKIKSKNVQKIINHKNERCI